MARPVPTLGALRPEYDRLFASAIIAPDWRRLARIGEPLEQRLHAEPLPHGGLVQLFRQLGEPRQAQLGIRFGF